MKKIVKSFFDGGPCRRAEIFLFSVFRFPVRDGRLRLNPPGQLGHVGLDDCGAEFGNRKGLSVHFGARGWRTVYISELEVGVLPSVVMYTIIGALFRRLPVSAT